jgi:hypothetical protein
MLTRIRKYRRWHRLKRHLLKYMETRFAGGFYSFFIHKKVLYLFYKPCKGSSFTVRQAIHEIETYFGVDVCNYSHTLFDCYRWESYKRGYSNRHKEYEKYISKIHLLVT